MAAKLKLIPGSTIRWGARRFVVVDYVGFGRRLTGSGDVDVWDVQSRKRLRTLREHTGDVSAVMLNTDGTIISASTDGSIRLWSADADTPRAVLETRPMFPIYGIAVDPERKRLVAAGGLIRRGMFRSGILKHCVPAR